MVRQKGTHPTFWCINLLNAVRPLHTTVFVALTLVGLASVPWLSAKALHSVSEDSSRFEALLQRGFELHRNQQYRRAIPLLEQARALRPRDYSVNLLLGIDYLRSGDTRKALSFLGTARDAQPGDSTALGYLAEAHASLQEFDKAAEALQLAASVPKAPPEAQLALTQFYLRRFLTMAEDLRFTRAGLAYAYRLEGMSLRIRKDPKEGETLLRVRSLAPDFPGLDSALGHFALSQGQFEDARRAFSQARLRNSNDLEMMVGEAVVAVRSSQLQPAQALLSEVRNRSKHRLQRAFREWPANIPLPSDLKRLLAETGQDNGESGDLFTPIELFQQQRWERLVDRLSKRDKTPEESFWLGTALVESERYGDAIPPLERAWHDSQFRLEAGYRLSLCYARSAEATAQRLSQAGKDHTFVHVVQGEVLLHLARDGVAAVEEYRKAVAALPLDPNIWSGLAASQLMAGDSEGARDSARKALQLDARRIPAARTFAEASMQQRDYAAAVPYLRQVLEAHSGDLGAQLLLGTAYAKTGEDQLALQFLKGALDQGYPDEKGTAHYLLGTVLQQLGQTKEADQAFEQAQALSDAFAQSPHGRAR